MIEPLDSRFLFSSGAVDPAFGTKGHASVKVASDGQFAEASQIVVDAAGHSYLCAAITANDNDLQFPSSYRIARLNADGSADTEWAASKHGVLKFAWSEMDSQFANPLYRSEFSNSRFRIAVDSADRLVVLDGQTLQRFKIDGTADTTFGDRGSVRVTAFRSTTDLQVAADNKMLISGTIGVHGHARMAVGCLISRGRLDATFGRRGFYAAPAYGSIKQNNPEGYYFGPPTDQQSHGQRVLQLADGDIVLAGHGDTGNTDGFSTGVQVVELTSDGRLDTTFGLNGVAESVGVDLGVGGGDDSTVIGITPDGTVVLEGIGTGVEPNENQLEYSIYFNVTLNPAHGGDIYGESVDLGPATDDTTSAVSNVVFAGRPGQAYFINADLQLFHQTRSGDIDDTFGDHGFLNAECFAIAQGNTILTVNAAGHGRVDVRRYFADE